MTTDSRRVAALLLSAAWIGASMMLAGCQSDPMPNGGTTRGATAEPSTDGASPSDTTESPTAPPTRSGPSSPPTPSVAPTPASPTNRAANLAVPELPEEARAESKAGLKAFMEHWLELLSYSYLANDLAPLNEVSNPGCTFCVQAETSMKQIYQLGWVSGGGTTLTAFTTDFQPDTNGIYSADITTTQAEIFYYSGEGWLGSSESIPDTSHSITARYVDGSWQLIDYATPEAGSVPSATASPEPGS